MAFRTYVIRRTTLRTLTDRIDRGEARHSLHLNPLGDTMRRISRGSLLVVPLVLCACHTYRTVPLSPQASGRLPEHSWVVRMGGERVPVEGGAATRDSIIGTRPDGSRVAIPRDSVAYVESREVSALRTAGAISGGVVVAYATLVVVALASLSTAW